MALLVVGRHRLEDGGRGRLLPLICREPRASPVPSSPCLVWYLIRYKEYRGSSPTRAHASSCDVPCALPVNWGCFPTLSNEFIFSRYSEIQSEPVIIIPSGNDTFRDNGRHHKLANPLALKTLSVRTVDLPVHVPKKQSKRRRSCGAYKISAMVSCNLELC